MNWTDLFSTQFIVLTILDYQLSLLEILGTVTNLACVILTAMEKVISWPIGILGIVFFFFLFYQSQLYSDMLLQVFFLLMTFYGWWRWTHPVGLKESRKDSQLKIRFLKGKTRLVWGLVIVGGTLALGAFMSQVHLLLPGWFPLPAAYPYADALTTVLSVAATLLMAEKRVECWILWVLVDIVSVILYFLREIHLTALLYVIFGIIASVGFYGWIRLFKKQEASLD